MREAQTFISAVGSDCGIANVNIGTSGAEIGGAGVSRRACSLLYNEHVVGLDVRRCDVIDAIFDGCVHLLVFMAGQLGMSYKAINVWIFVILWPLLTLALIGAVLVQQAKIRRLGRRLSQVTQMPRQVSYGGD